MYRKIKQLADEAIALQNKDRMDAVLREISALCTEEHVTYGIAKSFDSEAEMIADLQGAPSTVFPLPVKKGRAK